MVYGIRILRRNTKCPSTEINVVWPYNGVEYYTAVKRNKALIYGIAQSRD